jgi:hypothetical protein
MYQYVNNNILKETVTCDSCSKRDVCKYHEEFILAQQKAKEIEATLSKMSPIKINVSCRSTVKDVNKKAEFAKEYECNWINS